MQAGAPPTSILDLFAKSVRRQFEEEQGEGMRHVTGNVPLATRKAEMADWFRSLYIPPNDANAYNEKLVEMGFDCLEILIHLTEGEIQLVFAKDNHQRMVRNHLPELYRLTANTREECVWEWDDELGVWEDASASESDEGDEGRRGRERGRARRSWVPYATDVIRRAETARLSQQRDIIVYCGHNQKYRLDIVQMVQVNMRTGHQRKIRRVPNVLQRVNPPNSMLCPIGLSIMADPVMAADGHSYERANIEWWLYEHDTSPKTMLSLPHKNLIPNHSLRNAIEEFKAMTSA